MRRAAALLLALAALAGCGGGDERPDDRPRAAADRFLDGYVAGDGRVARRDQGGDTVSEGQAYALLLTAATGDERRFDRVWAWTRRELRRGDGLLAWKWADGAVRDRQPAADADLDAARALLVAAERFDRPELAAQARRTARSIRREETADGLLVAGPWAKPGAVVNPSYFSPRAERALGLDPGPGLAAARGLTDQGRLPPDWARGKGAVMPAPPPGAKGQPPAYGYDAVRLPIRFAEACSADERRVAAALWPVLRRRPAALPRGLDGTAAGRGGHPVALVGAAAAAHAAGDRAARDRLLDDAGAWDRRRPSYYGAAWVALGRVMLQTKWLGECGRPRGG